MCVRVSSFDRTYQASSTICMHWSVGTDLRDAARPAKAAACSRRQSCDGMPSVGRQCLARSATWMPLLALDSAAQFARSLLTASKLLVRCRTFTERFVLMYLTSEERAP